MKKLLLISAIIVALTAGYAFAQMGGGMMGNQQGQTGQSGMMGSQQGQRGQGGMMGGQDMMGGQGMMGPGMMGPGRGYDEDPGYEQDTKKYQKFLDDTTKSRKELYDKRFEYFEAMRNPDTKQETISKLEKEIKELQEKLYEKAPK